MAKVITDGKLEDDFEDTNLVLQDDADLTKQVKFELSNVATGTTRTLTIPDVSATLSFTDSNNEIPHHISKVASANVRNSHDAETSSAVTSYTKVKTITLTNGLLGQWRALFDLKSGTAPNTVNGRIYRNGVELGTEQSDVTGGYVTKSEDLTQDCQPGDTIELWLKAHASSTAWAQNFRLAYDDSPTVAVASSNS